MGAQPLAIRRAQPEASSFRQCKKSLEAKDAYIPMFYQRRFQEHTAICKWSESPTEINK